MRTYKYVCVCYSYLIASPENWKLLWNMSGLLLVLIAIMDESRKGEERKIEREEFLTCDSLWTQAVSHSLSLEEISSGRETSLPPPPPRQLSSAQESRLPLQLVYFLLLFFGGGGGSGAKRKNQVFECPSRVKNFYAFFLPFSLLLSLSLLELKKLALCAALNCCMRILRR